MYESCQADCGRLRMIRIVSGDRQGRRISKIQGTDGVLIVSLDMILSVFQVGRSIPPARPDKKVRPAVDGRTVERV